MARQTGARALPVWVDQKNRRVWQGPDCLQLRPQEFDVLQHLISCAGELVTKEALFKAVWQKDNPAYAAGDEVMTTCIYSLRQKLKDTGKPSRYIETTYKQGYRFIGPVAERAPVDPASSRPEREEPQTVSSSRSLPTVVGREEELSSLQQALDAAMAGARQVVFVTGEPGIGKTSLVRAFLQRVLDTGHAIVGQGQCVEHYGAGEAYLPILDALGRLCHEPGGNDMVEWMAQHAPTWLVQMPALVDAGKLEALQRRVQGATRERMLREMREGLEALTQNKPLVLVLEDLHWSDSSTLDLLRALAQGQGPARLCILGTYRPHEGLAEGHPLRSLTQELYGHGQGAEISLALLTNEAVDQYLVARFPRHGFPPRFAQVLYQLTDGNPFFLVALIDDLLRRGIIAEVDERWALQREIELIAAEVPENVRQLIGRQIDRLKGVEQRILAAASVVGLQFSAAAVAATVELPTADIEEACTVLARRQLFLQPAGVSEWPDGTMAGSYRFRHALHQYLWSERVTPSQLQQFHRRIGERLEQAYGKHVGEIAVELALHFEQGRDYERAVQYLQQAAANAMQRSACQEAIGHLTRGLNFLNAFPETLSRIEREINLQVMLGTAFMVVQGFAAPTVVNAYARALELCQLIGETPQFFSVLQGLWRFYNMRAEYQTAHQIGQTLLQAAQRLQDSELLLHAHHALGTILLSTGDFRQAQAHVEQGRTLYDLQTQHVHASFHGQDSKVILLSNEAHLLWLLGYPQQARQRCEEALTLSRQLNHPPSVAFALSFANWLLHCFRDWDALVSSTRELSALAMEQGAPLWAAQANVWHGWWRCEQESSEEGCQQIAQAMAAWEATGARLGWPQFLGTLAWAQGRAERPLEGVALLAEAIAQVEKSGEREWEAELYRLKGELFLQWSAQQPRPPMQAPRKSKSKRDPGKTATAKPSRAVS